MATRQVFADDNSLMRRTCCNFAKGLAARKQTNAFIRAKWNIPRWATGDKILPGTIRCVCAEPRKKSLSAQVNGDQEQLKLEPVRDGQRGQTSFLQRRPKSCPKHQMKCRNWRESKGSRS